MSKKLTTEQFIERSSVIHNNAYDYSLSEYKSRIESVIIICKTHGEFEQKATNHLTGRGCTKCGRDRTSNYGKHTKSDFIEKSKQKHNGFYEYNNVEYISPSIHVKIKCPNHGYFLQTPQIHLSGSGCKECANDSVSRKNKKGNDYFLLKFKEKHGSRYDYSLCKDIKGCGVIKIRCYEHGVFMQSAYNHYAGQGCPKCKSKNAKGVYCKKIVERNKEKFLSTKGCVYITRTKKDSVYKIGISKSLDNRMKSLRVKKKDIYYVHHTNLYDAFYLESKIQEDLREKRVTHGTLGGKTEHFVLTEDDLCAIRLMLQYRD